MPLTVKLILVEVGVAVATAAVVAYLIAKREQGGEEEGKKGEAEEEGKKARAIFVDANMPRDADGRTYHLNVKPGDVANRVLSVGDHGRAERIASLFDKGTHRVVTSTRSFVTHTGLYTGVPVSVIATGMGAPMMDFVVREARAIVAGPMALLRYGTCGGLGESREGTVVIPGEGSILVRRDPDAVGLAIEGGVDDSSAAENPSPSSPASQLLPTPASPYSVSRPVRPHAALTALLAESFRIRLGGLSSSAGRPFSVRDGVMDATADSFYSSQGRTNDTFVDNNRGLVARLERAFPLLACLQMETFHLFDLGRASRAGTGREIATSAAAIVIVNRTTGEVAGKRDVEVLELEGGRACLDTLVRFPLTG